MRFNLLALFCLIMLAILCSTAHAQEMTYYDELTESCNNALSESCCTRSVERMKSGGYLLADNEEAQDSCPEGQKMNMLKCKDSFKWCEPSGILYLNLQTCELGPISSKKTDFGEILIKNERLVDKMCHFNVIIATDNESRIEYQCKETQKLGYLSLDKIDQILSYCHQISAENDRS